MPFRTLIFRALALLTLALVTLPGPARAQEALQPALQAYADELASPSRRSIEAVVTALIEQGHPNIGDFFRRFSARRGRCSAPKMGCSFMPRMRATLCGWSI